MRRVAIALGWLAWVACLAVAWALNGWLSAFIAFLSNCALAILAAAIDTDDVETPTHESCDGCDHDLGGGHCAINVEGECREGGGFELWEDKSTDDMEVNK